VFDGGALQEGWAVRVRGDRIDRAAPLATIDVGSATVIDLPGTTLLPGLVEGHSHVLLHPYSETSWNDQVLRESTPTRDIAALRRVRLVMKGGEILRHER
jgi:imidazolonepropionase-like amidohydrolase